MKTSEIRDKTDDELVDLEKEFRDQLVKITVARATQRAHNSAQFSKLKKDVARVKTIQTERKLGLANRGEAAS